MNVTLNYIFRFLFILLGAGDIMFAIDNYHREKYFMCGFDIMFAAYMMIYLFKLSMIT